MERRTLGGLGADGTFVVTGLWLSCLSFSSFGITLMPEGAMRIGRLIYKAKQGYELPRNISMIAGMKEGG